MIDPSTNGYSMARLIYLSANTPEFLIRKLRPTPLVIGISRHLSADEICQILNELFATEAVNVDQRTNAALYLIALSLKGDPGNFKKLVQPPKSYRWSKSLITKLSRGPVATQTISISSKSRNLNSVTQTYTSGENFKSNVYREFEL